LICYVVANSVNATVKAALAIVVAVGIKAAARQGILARACGWLTVVYCLWIAIVANCGRVVAAARPSRAAKGDTTVEGHVGSTVPVIDTAIRCSTASEAALAAEADTHKTRQNWCAFLIGGATQHKTQTREQQNEYFHG
jgi:23S rRNA pseudoU1915 N3-methylase RlmH